MRSSVCAPQAEMQTPDTECLKEQMKMPKALIFVVEFFWW